MDRTEKFLMNRQTFNRIACERCYDFLDHQNVTEIRFIDPKKKKQPFSKFINTKKEFVEVCESYNGQYNIYAGIHEREGEGTKGEHVVAIKTIIIDIDAIREKGFEKQPATEEELKQAEIITDKIINDIKSKKGIKLHSGNGFQLWFAIPEIRINNINRKSIENKLQLFQDLIIEKYDVNGAIDKIGDLPRIIKVWGTYNIKGDNTIERPYRVATVVSDVFERNEDDILRETILNLDTKEENKKEYEFESTDEIDFDKLPPCIEHLLKYYENKDGKYWFRIIQFLASFFSCVKLDKEKAKQIIFDWNKKQEHHEEGEEKEILFEIDRVYNKKINVANCEKIKKGKNGFPFFGLADLKLCKPDNNCNKCINPVICWKRKNEDIKNNELINKAEIFTRRGQLEEFWKEQPFFYDKAKIFYLWDKEEYKWVVSDEVDFCNLIYKKLKINTISSRERSELVEGFKQVGRNHHPKEIPKSWVQFKNKVYDVKTDEVFEATPDYFVTNPIPYEVGDSEDTPTIDKLFNEWVDKKFVPTLYEIMAYNVITDKFMQRLIALCGGGSNGKGTFVKLNYKFIGENNCVSSEIKQLCEDKFEPAVLYKKTLCVAGEVSYDDLRNTNILKKLGGEDKISFQYKGKTPFTADNTATFMCLTNSLPITPDKSMGFYRKWLIIDFPNQFKQVKEDLIKKIPIEEFENLAKKCLRILKELYNNPKFTEEGDFDERMRRYEEHSNPVMHFVNECCIEEPGNNLILRDFVNACNDYLKSKHQRLLNSKQIGKVLRDEGFVVGNRRINDISAVVIVNLFIKKTIKTIKTIQKSNRFPREETNIDLDSFDSNNSNGIRDTSTINKMHLNKQISSKCFYCGNEKECHNQINLNNTIYFYCNECKLRQGDSNI